MEVKAQALQVDIPGESRIILRSLELKLKGKSQVILDIRVGEIIDIPCLCRIAESVKKHDPGRRLPVYISHKPVTVHSVPVQVDHHLY